MATKAEPSLYEALSAQFPTEQHRKKSGGGGRELTYIPAEAIISRLNSLWGVEWSWAIRSQDIDLKERVVVVTGVLTYTDAKGDTQSKCGIGADQDYTGKAEIDKLVKTANTEALKNAAKLVGVGLYLYDDEERAVVEREMAAQAPQRSAPAPVRPAPSGDVHPANAARQHEKAQCRKCNADIVWVGTMSGKKMPVDAGSIQAGETLFDKRAGHVSHFDTCTAAG